MTHLFSGMYAHSLHSMLFVYAKPGEFCLVCTAVVVSAIYMFGLIHCIGNDNIPGSARLFWSLIIVILPIIGTAAYWFIGRRYIPIRIFKEPEI